MDLSCCLLKLQPLQGLGTWLRPSIFRWICRMSVYEVLSLPRVWLRYDVPPRHPFQPHPLLQRNNSRLACSPYSKRPLAAFLSAFTPHAPLARKPETAGVGAPD